jgi:DNA-3-methyladenine glycosylase
LAEPALSQRVRREFFARDSPDVAPQLLNKVLVVGGCAGRIVEVEAYMSDDPASHCFRGRTPRNAVMYGPAGHLYVYFTYGMHHCVNIVTGDVDDGQAVLLRAVVPLLGIDQMVRRRGRDRHISDGPGKLCQAFGIDMAMNGTDVCAATSGDPFVAVYDDGVAPPRDLAGGPRIGISVATDVPWRWVAPQTPANH